LIQDITGLKSAENQLKHSEEQLRKLSSHLMSVREDEQKRIARRIHDELGQTLVGMQMNLSWLLDTLPKENAVWLEKIRSLLDMAEASMDSVEKITSELRPRILDVLGLKEAINWYLNEFETTPAIRYSVTFIPESLELNPSHSIILYRVFQEAISNVHRHARASEVRIRLEQQKNMLLFTIQDDGIGITREQIQAPNSFGLLGMQERVLALGGTLRIQGKPGAGTSIRVKIPLPLKESSE